MSVRPSIWINNGTEMSGATAVIQEPSGDFKTIGSIVIFGSYEQDYNISYGKEPTEWIVLDVQDGKAKSSENALDCQSYTLPMKR